ncbi:MAG: tryptophan 2,3-dioxygenase [Proteobacteria bacterium SG_bin7]|nr:MAG: tryptophan 2,3-dioxygenase [Proteobacteria bacterium SG_bin7]
MTKYPPLHYNDYLHIDQILSAQHLKSQEFGKPVHDEMLFIITHQAYELWFKQIITELNAMLAVFGKPYVNESDLASSVLQIDRIIQIQDLLIRQIPILETMTPMDFLEFRDFLFPSSGFQSFQNRLIECKLGLDAKKRLHLGGVSYTKYLTESQQKIAAKAESEPSLFALVEKWLERIPFLESHGFNFWQSYRAAVETVFQNEKSVVQANKYLSKSQVDDNIKSIDNNLKVFSAIFDEGSYRRLQDSGQFRISLKALQGALFIFLYRDQPALFLPFKFLTGLTQIDENFTTWRHRHALMAHRMLGKKIGTGGSSGHDYLAQAAEAHKIFTDFFNLTTFFIPKSVRPELPKELVAKLSFNY